MKNYNKISKYVNLTLISNFIFLDNFAGCCKKGGKENNNKGCSGKGNKSTETDTTPNEEQHKDETPDNPGKDKDYKKEIAGLLENLSNIKKNNDFLPEKKITFNKNDLESKIKSIDSDEKYKNIKDTLNNLSIDLNNNLEKLKLEYLRKFNDIKNGNTSLKLGITVDLNEENIKNLDFKDINNIKSNLDKLYNNYIVKLNDEAKKLKDEYDNLTAETEKLDEIRKNIVKSLLKLNPKDFQNITDYNKIQPIQEQINIIKNGIKDGIDGIKTEFQKKYKINKNINEELKLEIAEINEDLKIKIDNLSDKNIKEVTDNLNVIDEKIYNGIIKTQENLKKEYEIITKKIAIYKVYKKEYNTAIININITKDKAVGDYKKIENDIKELKESFDNTLRELRTEFQKKINDLNTKLEDLGLGLDKIDNKILNDLVFDKLTNKTISNIEDSINKANEKYNETITNYKNECSSNLENAKKKAIYKHILNFKEINNLINTINTNIDAIQTKADKVKVNESIGGLVIKIKEEDKKEAEKEKEKENNEKNENLRKDLIELINSGNYSNMKSAELQSSLNDIKIKHINGVFYEANINLYNKNLIEQIEEAIRNKKTKEFDEENKNKANKDLESSLKKLLIEIIENSSSKNSTDIQSDLNAILNTEGYKKNQGTDEITNLVNKIRKIIDAKKEEGEYSYDCTNSMYLTVYIYEGTDEAEFEIFLRNNGTKPWAGDSKLIIDQSSFLKTDDISLAPQKPNEERGYKTIIKGLGKYSDGEYKAIFLFHTNGKVRGEKITAIVKIKEKDNKKSEVDEKMEKINEFRDTFNLSEEEYSNEKLFEVLKDNDFNFEPAFSALFN